MAELEGTTKAMKIEYMLDALLDCLDLLENCAMCSFKDKVRVKKAIHYAEELVTLEQKYGDSNLFMERCHE